MFGDESMFCTEGFWCGTVFGAGRCLVRDGVWCGTGHLPEIDPAGLPFLGSPPQPS